MRSNCESRVVFTVIGFYPDTMQRFCGHAHATNADAAEREILVEYPDIAICGVIAGKFDCVDSERYVALS